MVSWYHGKHVKILAYLVSVRSSNVIFNLPFNLAHPDDPAPYMDGIKINSPHYLCKMVEPGSQAFSLVISQYEKLNTIHYTLRVYAQCEFNLTKIIDPYKHEKEVRQFTYYQIRCRDGYVLDL